MHVLVTYGSRFGGTEGIARTLAASLQRPGIVVSVRPAEQVDRLDGVDAVIVGGGLYANRWHRAARRFVRRHLRRLRTLPVWMFSSGPLDDSASKSLIPPTGQVTVLMERVGALGHATFGGRLAREAEGFPARAMAREHAGDWRDPQRIAAWADQVADALPTARAGMPIDLPGRSLARLVSHGVIGWAACAATMALLMAVTGQTAALVLHAIAAPIIFAAVSSHYFAAHGARDPLPTAVTFTALVAGLDLAVVAGLILRSAAMFGSVVGTWLPFLLIFLATWATGGLFSTLPWPRPGAAASRPHAHAS